MKKVTFKNPNKRLQVPGMGEVTNDNVTIDKYNRLVDLNAAHADLFNVTDEESEKKVSKSSKPNKDELQA